MTAPTLLRGGRGAAERAEVEKAAREKARKSSFNTWEYLRLEAPPEGEVYGESIVVRFVTDEPDWIEVKQHNFVNTKAAPADKPSDKKWPKSMGAVCRYTQISDGADGTKNWFEDCVICDKKLAEGEGKNGKYVKKPGVRLWAVAVERQEVLGTQEMADAGEIESYEVGSPVRYEDVEVERQVDGKTVTDKKWLVINQAMENFFDSVLGSVNVHKTALDVDYRITRKGRGTDTGYSIVALEAQTVEIDGKQVKFDLRRPEIAALYQPPFELVDIVSEQASDKHYDWFFNPDVESSWEERFGKKDENGSSSNSGSDEATNEKPKEAKSENKANLAAMKARLQK